MASVHPCAPSICFGVSAGDCKSLCFIDDVYVAYAAGHCVVIASSETRQQRLITGNADNKRYSALAVCESKRIIAVAEVADKAQITLYDSQNLKRKKTLTSIDSTSKVGPHYLQ